MSDVTEILSQIASGDQQASQELLPLVYAELRKLAASRMTGERADHTLQATALVHEAYLRLVGAGKGQRWDGRGHFFSAAAEAMRRILVDHARQKQSLRQGGNRDRQELVDVELGVPDTNILELSELIDRLEEDHDHAAKVVKLKFFCGMTIAEIAEALGISHATVERTWAYARARLHADLLPKAEPS